MTPTDKKRTQFWIYKKDGDWFCDKVFMSSDEISAFSENLYEQGSLDAVEAGLILDPEGFLDEAEAAEAGLEEGKTSE